MGEKEPFLYDRLAGTEGQFVLSEIVRQSVELYGSPSVILGNMAAGVPDDRLEAFAGLAKRVRALETLDGVDGKLGWLNPLQPDFTRSELMADGRLRVPVADRHSLQQFLQRDEVAAALSAYYTQLWQHEDIQAVDNEHNWGALNQTTVQSQINVLPINVKPLDTRALFVLAGAYYWSEQGADRYVMPADTLEDIVSDAPKEMLAPLILTLDDHFPPMNKNGFKKPVIWMLHTKEHLVDNGVIWKVFSDRDLRWQIEDACRSDEPALNRFNGFNSERFNQAYYQALARRSQNPTDELRALDKEQERRYATAYSWMLRVSIKSLSNSQTSSSRINQQYLTLPSI